MLTMGIRCNVHLKRDSIDVVMSMMDIRSKLHVFNIIIPRRECIDSSMEKKILILSSVHPMLSCINQSNLINTNL